MTQATSNETSRLSRSRLRLRVTALFGMGALLVAGGCSSTAPEEQTSETSSALSTGLVISQVYGGGGNSQATYTHDFVELFNRSNSPISLNGKSIQYASDNGNFAAVAALPNVSVPAGGYFLVKLAGGSV